MPLSLKAFTEVMRSLPEGVSQEQINAAADAAEKGTPLEHLWSTLQRPLAGSADALIPQLRHEHGPEEGGLRRTAEDFGAGLTSPASLGTMAAGVGAAKAGAAGMLGISNAARAAEAGLQAPLAVEGIRNIVEGDSLGQKLAGAAQAGMASAGIKNASEHAFEPSAVVKTFTKEKGLTPQVREPLNTANAMKTADNYVAMEHAPNNPAVAASYGALQKEIKDQYLFLRDRAGLKMTPSTEGYPTSKAMTNDVRQNNNLKYFPTESGYGPQASDVSDHPLLQKDPDTGLSYNDMFRAVHDYFGHAAEGNQFGPKGEQLAYGAHKDTLTPAAHGALTTETKGQNSFVNFGPHMRDEETGALRTKDDPQFLSPAARPYAEQKAGLLPEYLPHDAQDASSTQRSEPSAGAPANPSGQSPSLALSDELAALINQSHAAGGSTTSLTGNKLLGMEDGKYMLSPYHDRQVILDHPPTPEELRGYVAKNQDLLSQPGHNLGTWNNEGKHYLDVSIAENDLPKALALGAKHNQLAIYDMVNGKDIPVEPEARITGDGRLPEQAFSEHAKTQLVDGPVAELEKLHSMGVPGAAEDAARIRAENPGRQIGSTAMAVAGPAAAVQIDDSDPNDPNYALKHYGKLGMLLGSGVAMGAALRTSPSGLGHAVEALPIEKNAASKGAALMMLGNGKREITRNFAEMGVPASRIPVVHAAAEKILQTQIENAGKKGLTKTTELMKMLNAGKPYAEWYGTGDELRQFFGKDAEVFANLLAATSNNAEVKSNVALALKAYAQWKINPEADPIGIMGTVVPAVKKALTNDPLLGRKVHNFARALMGDPDAVVVDRWMMRAFGFMGPKNDVPTAQQYDFIEHAVKKLAQDNNMTPREVQAAIWYGAKDKIEAGTRGELPPSYQQNLLEREKSGLSLDDPKAMFTAPYEPPQGKVAAKYGREFEKPTETPNPLAGQVRQGKKGPVIDKATGQPRIEPATLPRWDRWARLEGETLEQYHQRQTMLDRAALLGQMKPSLAGNIK